MTDEDDQWHKGHGGEEEAVPGQFQRRASGLETAQDLLSRLAQDVRIVEAPAEQEEEEVERHRHHNQQEPGDSFQRHQAAAAAGRITSSITRGARSSCTRRRPLRMVTTIAPLAPKFVNCWSTLIPAAVVTTHPKAHSGGMAIAHQNQVATCGRRTSACRMPTPRPVMAPWMARSWRPVR